MHTYVQCVYIVCNRAILWPSQWFKFSMLVVTAVLPQNNELWWTSFLPGFEVHIFMLFINFPFYSVCETVCKTWWQSIRKGRTKSEDYVVCLISIQTLLHMSMEIKQCIKTACWEKLNKISLFQLTNQLVSVDVLNCIFNLYLLHFLYLPKCYTLACTNCSI